MMSSTCFEPEGSSSGGRLYVQLWYSVFYMLKLLCTLVLYYYITMHGAKKRKIMLECIGQWPSSGFLCRSVNVNAFGT